MRPFRFLEVSDDGAEAFAADVVARRPSDVPARELVAAPDHCLYVGGEAAEDAGLDPQYRAARLLVDADGEVGAVAFCDFALPDPHLRPHSIAFLAKAGRAFFVVCDAAQTPALAAAIPLVGGRRLVYTRVHHPRMATIGTSVAWWQALLDEPASDAVLAAVEAALTRHAAAFRWIASRWTEVGTDARTWMLLRSIEDSIVFEASECSPDAEGGSLIVEGRWPWGSYPCLDHPEDFARALHERPFECAVYPVGMHEIAMLRSLMMPCGVGLRGKAGPSRRPPLPLYHGLGGRAFLSGSFRLGRREFGIVQTQGTALRAGSCMRTGPLGGRRLPVIAALIKAHDHRGLRNPEEQRGIGLVEIGEDFEEEG